MRKKKTPLHGPDLRRREEGVWVKMRR